MNLIYDFLNFIASLFAPADARDRVRNGDGGTDGGVDGGDNMPSKPDPIIIDENTYYEAPRKTIQQTGGGDTSVKTVAQDVLLAAGVVKAGAGGVAAVSAAATGSEVAAAATGSEVAVTSAGVATGGEAAAAGGSSAVAGATPVLAVAVPAAIVVGLALIGWNAASLLFGGAEYGVWFIQPRAGYKGVTYFDPSGMYEAGSVWIPNKYFDETPEVWTVNAQGQRTNLDPQAYNETLGDRVVYYKFHVGGFTLGKSPAGVDLETAALSDFIVQQGNPIPQTGSPNDSAGGYA